MSNVQFSSSFLSQYTCTCKCFFFSGICPEHDNISLSYQENLQSAFSISLWVILLTMLYDFSSEITTEHLCNTVQ